MKESGKLRTNVFASDSEPPMFQSCVNSITLHNLCYVHYARNSSLDKGGDII